MPLITLTTDFGARDWFVGTMKGVILGLNECARIVDITHEVPAGDLRAGAFAVAASYRFFPKGTIHVAVVDPGVGSARKAIAVQTATYCFVGPDNGVLSWALRTEPIQAIRVLENPKYFRLPVSRTFHGRDIFAPVAAHLSRRVPLRELGPPQEEFVRLNWPAPGIEDSGIHGEVVYIDRFGNAITNLDAAALGDLEPIPVGLPRRGSRSVPVAYRDRLLSPHSWQVFRGRKRVCAVATCYQSVRPNCAVAVMGSSGLLEIAINGGNAARRLGLRVGHQLTLRHQ